MRKRKQVIYVKQSYSGLTPQSRDTYPSSRTVNSSRSVRIRLPAFNKVAISRRSFNLSVYLTGCPELTRLKTATHLKFSLILISGLSATINWVSTLLGFIVISGEDANSDPSTLNYLKLGVALISLLEATFVVLYWKCSLKYMEVVNTVLNVRRDKVTGLRDSPAALLSCVLESAFQLIVFVPWVNYRWAFTLFGVDTVLSLDDCIYVFVLLRSYHTLRFLYWYSRFSNVRTFMYTRVIHVDMSPAFMFRCFLAEYGLKLLILVFLGTTLIYGLLSFVAEEGDTNYGATDIWNKMWVVAYTDATIGYGDDSPTTFFGRVAVICCCFWGIFMHGSMIAFTVAVTSLNLTECSMYSELLYTREKTKYFRSSVLLLQHWWRFMLMRKNRCPRGFAMIAFYSQLRVYRGVLVKCQLVKDHRFERQIIAFGQATSKRIRSLNEYLRPVIYTEYLVHFT